jgi:hypothetical protein
MALFVKMDSRRHTVAGLATSKNIYLYTPIAALAAMGRCLTIVDAKPNIDEIQP